MFILPITDNNIPKLRPNAQYFQWPQPCIEYWGEWWSSSPPGGYHWHFDFWVELTWSLKDILLLFAHLWKMKVKDAIQCSEALLWQHGGTICKIQVHVKYHVSVIVRCANSIYSSLMPWSRTVAVHLWPQYNFYVSLCIPVYVQEKSIKG